MVKQILSLYVGLVFLTLLTHDTTSDYPNVSQEFQDLRSNTSLARPTPPTLLKLSPAPGIGIVPNCWRYLEHGTLFNTIEEW